MDATGTTAATSGSNLWIVAVNIVIWTGLFLFLLRLDAKLANLERGAAYGDEDPAQ